MTITRNADGTFQIKADLQEIKFLSFVVNEIPQIHLNENEWEINQILSDAWSDEMDKNE